MNTLSFDGDGKVKVAVKDIVASPQFKAQLEAVRELADSASNVGEQR